MPSISLILGTLMSPMVPVAQGLAFIFGVAALHALSRKRPRAALLWSLAFCGCVGSCVYSLRREPNYEADVIGDLRTLSALQAAYASGNGGFYATLPCLEKPSRCGWPEGIPLSLDPELASLRTKGEYARSFVPGPRGRGKLDPGIVTFVYIAMPIRRGETAVRSFAVDHTGRICQTIDGSVPPIVDGALSSECFFLQ